MRVITKQLTKEILLSTAFVLVALVALFAFFDLIGQLDDVGSGRTMQQAFTLTALSLLRSDAAGRTAGIGLCDVPLGRKL